MALARTKKLIILSLVFVTLGAALYFTLPHLFSRYDPTEVTVQAWSMATYSFGSTKWMFFYSPNWYAAPQSLKIHFPFAQFAPPNVHLDQPILLLAFKSLGSNGTESEAGLAATAGASYTWDGVEMTVSEVNSTYLVLSFKPSS